MSVGINIIGREVTLTLGASALLGVTSKSNDLTNEMADTTDDDASGWTEKSATPLLKNNNFSIDGILKNLELLKAFFETSQIFAVVETFPDGSIKTFDAALVSFSYSAGSNEQYTYSAGFESSGVVVFTPGV